MPQQLTKAWFATIAAALLFACSSKPGDGSFAGLNEGDDARQGSSGVASSGGSGSGGGSGVGASSGAGSSSGGSSGASSSGASGSGSSGVGAGDGGAGVGLAVGLMPSEIGKTVTLTATSFQVAPNEEVYKCQVFANPFAGAADLIRLHGTMSAGSHHFFLFNMTALEAAVEPAVGTLGDCTGKGLEFHPFPFLSQQPDWTVQFPRASDGSPMGYPLVAANYLMINVHYLNASSAPITASVSITIDAAKPDVVKTHVGTLFLDQASLSVPVTPMGSPVSESKSWSGNPGAVSADGSYDIFTSWSHMHKWGVDFTASTNGQVFYDEEELGRTGALLATTRASPTRRRRCRATSWSPIRMTSGQSIFLELLVLQRHGRHADLRGFRGVERHVHLSPGSTTRPTPPRRTSSTTTRDRAVDLPIAGPTSGLRAAVTSLGCGR